MNKINKGWKEVKLGDIVDITMGQSPKSEFYNKRNEGMLFYKEAPHLDLCILILKHIQAILKR